MGFLKKIGRGYLRRPRAIAAGLLVALVTAGFGAWALWTVTGSGSEYAGSSGTAALTTTLRVAPSQLYPGATIGAPSGADVVIRISNPNVFPVRATGVTVTGYAAGNDVPAPCFVTVADQVGLTIDIAAGSSADASFPDAAGMGLLAPDSCQSRQFEAIVNLTAVQTT
jgi:hypothetical protein